MTTTKQVERFYVFNWLISWFLLLYYIFFSNCAIHSGYGSETQKVQPNPSNLGRDDASSVQRPPTAKIANMTDIGSRSLFGPEQDTFRETVRKFFAKEVVPHYSKYI